jgi:PKD domain-containing protein
LQDGRVATFSRALQFVSLAILLSALFLPYSIPRARADSVPVLSIFSEDYNSPDVIDPSLTVGINFTIDVQASGLPAIVDQASGGLEGFDVSISYNSSVLRADGMSFASPLCPSSEGCIFDTPVNNTLTYHNSTSITGGTARLAMIGLGPGHRATNSTGPGLPPVLFRIRFLVVGKGVTPITIGQNSQLIGYSSNSCSLLSYQLTSTSNGSFDNRPPFTVSANPSSLSIALGSGGSTMVFVNATRPDVPANATLTLSGLVSPIDGTFTFNPRSEVLDSTNPSFTSALSISIKSSSTLGKYTLEIVAVNGFIPGDPSQQFRLRFNLTIIAPGGYVPASPSGTSVQVSTTPVITPSASASSPSTPPVIATFTFNSSAMVGTRVSFVPTVWCGTSPYSYAWSFGDRTTSTNSSATHTYSAAGTYNVTLTVTDSAGQTFTSSRMVNVEAQPAPAPPAPSDNGPLIGVILVLFLIIATSFVMLRRRRRPRR